jgi:hypothetical protein
VFYDVGADKITALRICMPMDQLLLKSAAQPNQP